MIACFCEENVYKMLRVLQERDEDEDEDEDTKEAAFAVFLSSKEKCFPLWEQKSCEDSDR